MSLDAIILESIALSDIFVDAMGRHGETHATFAGRGRSPERLHADKCFDRLLAKTNALVDHGEARKAAQIRLDALKLGGAAFRRAFMAAILATPLEESA